MDAQFAQTRNITTTKLRTYITKKKVFLKLFAAVVYYKSTYQAHMNTSNVGFALKNKNLDISNRCISSQIRENNTQFRLSCIASITRGVSMYKLSIYAKVFSSPATTTVYNSIQQLFLLLPCLWGIHRRRLISYTRRANFSLSKQTHSFHEW